jgi:outer membrane protein assembly factor BamB
MRESRYYIVVSALGSPTSCVVLALLLGVLVVQSGARGQSPELLPLLPAEEVWQVILPALPAAGGAMDALRTYVPLVSGEIVALDRPTGSTLWRAAGATALPPVAEGETVYVAAADGLYALAAGTGTIRWMAPAEPAAAAPILASGVLLAPQRPGGVLAIGQADGQPLWRQPLDGTAVVAVTAAAQTIFVAGADARVTALAAADGRVIWQRVLDGAPATLTAARDRLFVGTTDHRLYALDPRSGRTRWDWSLAGAVVGAVADDHRVYVATLDTLFRSFNRGNGHQRWRQALPTRPLAPPRLLGSELVITGVDPALSTFRADTGAPLATYTTPDAVLVQGWPLLDPDAAPADVHLVVVLRDGRVVGLRRE